MGTCAFSGAAPVSPPGTGSPASVHQYALPTSAPSSGASPCSAKALGSSSWRSRSPRRATRRSASKAGHRHQRCSRSSTASLHQGHRSSSTSPAVLSVRAVQRPPLCMHSKSCLCSPLKAAPMQRETRQSMPPRCAKDLLRWASARMFAARPLSMICPRSHCMGSRRMSSLRSPLNCIVKPSCNAPPACRTERNNSPTGPFLSCPLTPRLAKKSSPCRAASSSPSASSAACTPCTHRSVVS